MEKLSQQIVTKGVCYTFVAARPKWLNGNVAIYQTRIRIHKTAPVPDVTDQHLRNGNTKHMVSVCECMFPYFFDGVYLQCVMPGMEQKQCRPERDDCPMYGFRVFDLRTWKWMDSCKRVCTWRGRFSIYFFSLFAVTAVLLIYLFCTTSLFV